MVVMVTRQCGMEVLGAGPGWRWRSPHSPKSSGPPGSLQQLRAGTQISELTLELSFDQSPVIAYPKQITSPARPVGIPASL